MQGRIHSLESFGTVDGPGIRFVVFFQGCPMRCQYCHNPDTWKVDAGTLMSADEILKQYERNKEFYGNGGITATGGEPLLQMPFLIELFREAKKRGIHTCLDTSGITYREIKDQEFQELFQYTDLVMLDIKCADPIGHKELTANPIEPVIGFMHALSNANVPLRIRHVVVPGITQDEKQLKMVGKLIAPFKNLVGLEVLPYHTMGISKYESMGMEYPLKGVKPLTAQDAKDARKIIIEAMKEERQGLE